MKVCGLTGGVGMGKSTAARFLREHGAQIADTDELARQLVQPGRPALAEIQKVFGRGMISSDGQLRRDELAKIVFADPAARKKLEDILHPRIREQWFAQVENWRAAPKRGGGGRMQDSSSQSSSFRCCLKRAPNRTSIKSFALPARRRAKRKAPSARLDAGTNRAAQRRPDARRTENSPR